MISALELYATALAAPNPADMCLRVRGGPTLRVPLQRWLGPTTPADESVLDRARGPVIDLGCGPGRHLHGLARRGVFALGVDISPAAVELARTRGATAIQASVFDELPGAGGWRTALLLDGNIGIGGQPASLLRRLHRQLSDDGEILIELEAPSVISETVEVRIEDDGESSDWLSWARVGAGGVDRLAAEAGLTVSERWHQDGRWFVRLGPAQNPLPGPRIIPVVLRAEPHLPVRPGAH